MTWGSRGSGWLVTGAGVLLVGAVAVMLDWPPTAAAGWLILVVVGGVWLERRRPPPALHCAFCRRTQHEVERLIAAEDQTAICGDCIRLSAELLDQHEQAPVPGPTPEPPGPPGDPWTPPGAQDL